ncbi:MAG: AbrB/MazE/SpoVT family DNA-binding domain-containing protein [Nitrospinae bacterium]|nr:AbrB/MazE/SpoVT family DNA-binding domain-containing protein [Nitrospinota bacterium]MBI3813895.1 AbrB/MazE/SpoVT family DNA-binding domain-containing protein [Nitrospinota bacterium]
MKTLLSERGQVVIPKKVRESIKVEKGDEFEIEVVGINIVLKPIKRFKAQKWQDYIGIGDGVADAHLKEKQKEKEKEDVCP